MAEQGATFNLVKKVVGDGDTGDASQPSDGAKLEKQPKLSGEHKNKTSFGDLIGLQAILNVANTATNTIISGIENSQAQAQIGVIRQVGTSAIAMVAIGKRNPYALLAYAAGMSIKTGAEVQKFNREKEWERFDIEQYQQNRGYSAMYNRSRSE